MLVPVVVVSGLVDMMLDGLNRFSEYGELQITSTPLRSYESFARSSLGMKDEELKEGTPAAFRTDVPLFWSVFEIGYEGLHTYTYIDLHR